MRSPNGELRKFVKRAFLLIFTCTDVLKRIFFGAEKLPVTTRTETEEIFCPADCLSQVGVPEFESSQT